MAIQTPSGVIIQEAVQQLITGPLEEVSTFLASGVTTVNSSAPVRLPVITPSLLPAYTSPGEEISDNQVNWDEVEGLPSSRRGIKGWYPISAEAVRATAINGLPNVVEQRILTDIAQKLDRVMYVGHSDGVSAVQTIVIENDTDGTFTCTYRGQTTSALDHDVSTAGLQTALRGLSTIGASNVDVSGSAGDYTITFAGDLANTQVDEITVNGASLVGTGATATATLVTQGIEAGGIQGIFNQAGTLQAEMDVTDLDSFLDAIGIAKANNVMPDAWYLNPVDYVALRKIHRGSGDVSYVLGTDPHSGPIPTLFGVKLVESNHIPQGKAALGATRYGVVIMDQNASVFVTEHALAKHDALAIRVTLRADLVLTQPSAWVILSAS